MIGIETGSLSQTIRGVGMYTLTLLEALKAQSQKFFCCAPSPSRIPFANSFAALFRSRCFEKVDLMHFPDPKILYGTRPKIPIVLTIHDVMPLLFPQFFPRKSRLLMQHFLPRFLRDADAIICPSHQTKRDLMSVFSLDDSKVHIIPLALLPKKRKIQDEKEPFLFYVGSFEPRKNLIGILEAFAQIKKEGLPHKLFIAGKEEGKNRLPHTLIDKLGLRQHIRILGYLSEEEKTAYLQKTALFLWPSFYEGFGIPLLEAMAAGAPIVTSNVSSMPEVTGNAALLVNPYDADQIAKAAIQVLTSQAMAKKLREKGLKRSEDFSLNCFGENHLLVYSSLLPNDTANSNRRKK